MILYAIPAPLGGAPAAALPAAALEIVRGLADFVVERPKSARAFLSGIGMARPLRELSFAVLDEHTRAAEVPALLAPLREGRPLGLLSEAGCPAIADPGAALIEAAHREGFTVRPLVGPSSIVLALMASGMQGQRFAFCGYLPREPREREARIRALEKRSRAEDETEVFIETPYRNDALLGALLATCHETTRLCVAADLTLPSEAVATRTVAQWRALASPAIGRRPAVFLLYAR
ncbi:MAG TPA: SAM-dependent methyltransferase [Burkholderiales bacterium]|nr:SAM-dependent methyltransferase [Burkholderiales bacterium]